jgi:hypothetical protein
MKKYTHAWLAFMAIRRLENLDLSRTNRVYAGNLVQWFKSHRDGVAQGAWYPDSVIKDMANSHVLKLTPLTNTGSKFRRLPTTYLNYRHGKSSPVGKQSFSIDEHDNLPDRCESIAQSVIDHLKIQESEEKGSPVSPTDNQVALLLFMLSHYIADAHMPFHCDSRRFSEGIDLHSLVEGDWEDKIEHYYQIDKDSERFFYDQHGHPMKNANNEREYESSILRTVDDVLNNRKFVISWGAKNKNVWDFMSAICQHSYLLSYSLIPQQYDYADVTSDNWMDLGLISFEDLSVAALSDAIDSIARVWFRIWRRFMKWERARK